MLLCCPIFAVVGRWARCDAPQPGPLQALDDEDSSADNKGCVKEWQECVASCDDEVQLCQKAHAISVEMTGTPRAARREEPRVLDGTRLPPTSQRLCAAAPYHSTCVLCCAVLTRACACSPREGRRGLRQWLRLRQR